MYVPKEARLSVTSVAEPVASREAVPRVSELPELGSMAVKVTVPEGTTPAGVVAATVAKSVNAWPKNSAVVFDEIVVAVARLVAGWISWQNSEVLPLGSVAVAEKYWAVVGNVAVKYPLG
jgi:hypothetical protein